ncbi:hypothetical protein [Methanomethylophilus alvi]|uniref:hypothetical protein n=1 Tax=Methanomethylophilus alvi TaxID=1291540 RepID=UPI0037DC6ECE
MPRQDVPYGGAICRLKERIAEIWDELGKKLHSINGVEGDAAGDVKIVSGDAAVVITNDQVNHEIEIALDSSQLPAAAVSSVNGQTGAVVLDASDINVIGGSDVATDLTNLDADLQQAQTDIAQEALTRANADSALQTNINTISASIPEMSETPDPYKGVKRDAQGRAFAADPANGATDRSLTTANWISQSGDSAPNNLMHKIAEEQINGTKKNTAGYAWVCKSEMDENNTIPADNIFYPLFAWFDKNNHPSATIVLAHNTQGKLNLYVRLLKYNEQTGQDEEVGVANIISEA